MNIPNLPTDNLYKFLTIAGLVLIFASAVWFEAERQDAFVKADNASLRARILEIEKEHLEKEELGLNVSRQRMFEGGLRPSDVEEQQIEAKTLNEQEKAFQIKEAEVEAQAEVANRIISKLELARVFFSIGVGLGFFLTGAGLRFWYTKLQVYQDRLVKKQAEK